MDQQRTEFMNDFEFSMELHWLLKGLRDAHTAFYMPRNYGQFMFSQPLPLGMRAVIDSLLLGGVTPVRCWARF
jgi:hypothetical protein